MAKTIADKFWDEIDNYTNENCIPDAMDTGVIVSENPLRIKIDDLVLPESFLIINPYLKEWTEKVNITTSENHNHTHNISTIIHPSKLKKGRKVFCYGFEYMKSAKSYQKYYVLEVIG